MKKLSYYQDVVKEGLTNDKTRDEKLARFEKILTNDIQLPPEIKQLGWVRTMKTSAAVDGIDAAVRAFSTVLPVVHVSGNLPTPEEAQRAEAIEDALMWHFKKANQRGVRRPLELVNDTVIKYGAVGVQVRYLPYDFKGRLKEPRVKAMLRQGSFAYFVHKPIDVHAIMSPYGLESVFTAKVMTVADMIRQFGEDNEGVKKLMAKVRDDKQKSKPEWESVYLSYYDLNDFEVRVQWASLTGVKEMDKDGGGKDAFEFTREEHKLPFLPFIYREANKPLLLPLIESDAVENQTVLRSLQYALLVSTVAQARSVSYTYSGDGLKVDFKNPGGQVKAKVGEQFQVTPPAQTDPNLEKQVAAGEMAITQSLQTRALQAASEIAQTAPFATFNAILQTALSSLSLQRNTAEAVWEDIFTQELEWVKHSKIPLIAQRPKGRENASFDITKAQGAQIAIGDGMPVDFSPDKINISVRLRADTPTDEQARMNKATQLIQVMKFSVDDALEASGLDEFERNNDSYLAEQFANAMLAAKQQEIMASAQLKVQMAQMQMQQQFQQAQQQGQMQMQAQAQAQQQAQMQSQQQPPMAGQGPMYNPAQQGMPPATANPNETREMVTGQTASGEEMV